MTMKINAPTKHTNIPWLGDIPADWEVRRLKFVFKYVTGATPDSGKHSYYSSEGFNWITISDLNGKYTKVSKNKITQEGVDKKNMTIVPAGSLLYSFKLSVGQMSFVELPTYTNEAIFSILPESNLNLDFWYYALESYLMKSANENIYGAKIFNQDSIDNAQLICPPLPTQQVITSYLDTKCDLIAKYIADKTKIIELLKEQKKSLIYNAVTKGLDQNTKLKSSGVEWLGDIPSYWEVRRLKSVAKIKTGTTPKDPDNNQSFVDGNIPWYSPGDFRDSLILPFITDKMINSENNIDNTEIYPENTVFVIGIGATTGKFCISRGKSSSNQQLNSIIFDQIKVFPDFALYFFSTIKEIVLNEANAATLPILNQTLTKNLILPLPPLETQQAIVTYLDTQTAIIDDTISKIQREIELIQEYKKSLIYGVVTGKILI
jgi:type I restriction enzyme, S subunit